MKRMIGNLYRLCLPALLLLALGGCGTTDDVVAIFTGKNWKLTQITQEGSSKLFNFWGDNNTAYKASMKLLEVHDNFTLNFNGASIEGTTNGNFNGRGGTISFNGTWRVDDASRSLQLGVIIPDEEKDIFARAFRTGILNAFRYEGDVNNLYIYYKDEKDHVMCLWFHPQ
jgi:hypothetical protein